MEKVIKDNQVAVLVSHGWGAGWSTWAIENRAEMVFCPEIVNAKLEGKCDAAILQIAEDLFPEQYHGGLDDVVVEWVPVGERFTINEYDGNESLLIFGPDHGYLA